MLDLHEDRRAAGVPTVSVLRGSTSLGLELFTNWARERGFWVATVSIPKPGGVAEQLAAALGAHPTLRLQAVRAVARAADTSVESVLTLVDSHSQDAALLFERARGVGSDGAFACALLGRGSWNEPTFFPHVLELLSASDKRPALVAPLGYRSTHAAVLQEWVGLIELAPALTTGVVIDRVQDAKDLTGVFDDNSRWMTMLKEGLIEVPGEIVPPVPDHLAPEQRATRQVLVNSGATPSTIRAFDRAAGFSAPAKATQESQARSAQEALLYQVLRDHGETAGLFELNGKMDFEFGQRAMEVDLVSRRLGIAIEIDGYYHFQGSVPYRRDRRKDELLQQHGYLILRFLADDIVPELQAILNTIISNVRLKQQEKVE